MEVDAEAFRRVAARRRFALLSERARRRACSVYVQRRQAGYSHDEAAWVVRNDPELAALPWWAAMLLSLLVQALWKWWINRDQEQGAGGGK